MIRLSNRLGASLNLPVTVGWRRVPLLIGVPNVPNAHGDGNVVVGRRRIEARQITLSGSIYYPSRQQIRDMADTIMAFLQHAPIEVFQWPGSPRRMYAYPQGVDQDWMDAGAELVLNIPMLVPDPYWYGAEVTATEENATAWQVEVDGTAPTPPVVRIEVTAPGTDLLLTNSTNGRTLLVEGSYLVGDVVTVYTATYEATLTRSGETSPIVDALGDEFVLAGFELEPDTNVLTYTGPAADVTLTYRPRWY